MRISVPKDDFESDGFEPVEPGMYRAVICTPEYKKSKNDPEGKGYFNIPFKIETDQGERTVWSNYSLKDSAIGFLAGLVKAADIPFEESDGMVDFDSDDLDGCEVLIEVGVRMYNDKPQNEVKNVRSVT